MSGKNCAPMSFASEGIKRGLMKSGYKHIAPNKKRNKRKQKGKK